MSAVARLSGKSGCAGNFQYFLRAFRKVNVFNGYQCNPLSIFVANFHALCTGIMRCQTTLGSKYSR